ncbi:hypothetical protein F4808DRAFT_258089 [Astrocystis sublimbata]|nr:hypothetical protein F4808DRAFT_258089 [Astrocystis sublimbata]
MLPSRELARNPASALRYSLSSRTKPSRTLSTRSFSQIPSQSSVLSRRRLSRTTLSQHGPSTTPSISAAGYGASAAAIASSVFAQRCGATRNLSLWPFGNPFGSSKPSTAETTSSSSSAEPLSAATAAEATAPPPPVVDAPPSQPPPTDYVPDLSQLPQDLLGEWAPEFLFDDAARHIGYLKELGLDYNWGPTSMCEWMLEHIHVYSGLPWWGSLAAVAFLFRAVIFVPTIIGAKHSARLQLLQSNPAFAKAQEDFRNVLRGGDRMMVMHSRHRMKILTKEAGVNNLMPFVGMVMIPFSFGMFRLIRAMANIPVPGLDVGGMAWFTDLTIHDPLFILPILSTGLSVLMIKQMQRANVSTTPNPAQEAVQKGMVYIMPPLMFVGTAWMPAALQWFFLTVSVSALAQSSMTLLPSVRRYFNLPPLPNRSLAGTRLSPRGTSMGGLKYQSPTKAATAAAAPKKTRSSLVASFNQGLSAAGKSFREATGATEEKARFNKAKDYEQRRAKEEKEATERRMAMRKRGRA